MRKDLPIGTISAQLVHAAGESSGRVPSGTHAVVLAATDESHLMLIEKRLIKAGIPHVAVREPDLDNELTAIGIEPCDRRTLRRELSNLPLLR